MRATVKATARWLVFFGCAFGFSCAPPTDVAKLDQHVPSEEDWDALRRRMNVRVVDSNGAEQELTPSSFVSNVEADCRTLLSDSEQDVEIGTLCGSTNGFFTQSLDPTIPTVPARRSWGLTPTFRTSSVMDSAPTAG